MSDKQYFECHITIDPSTIGANSRGHSSFSHLTHLAKSYDFRVSDFIMLHPDAPTPKAFVSGRASDLLQIKERMETMGRVLSNAGFRVVRKKLEFAFYDERIE